jgi:hypothetical protein
MVPPASTGNGQFCGLVLARSRREFDRKEKVTDLDNDESLVARVARLELQLKTSRYLILVALLVCLFLGAGWGGLFIMKLSGRTASVIRTSKLVITDNRGVDRIIIGAPAPSAPNEVGPRVSPMTGMILLDRNGRERFGVGLQDTGMLSMGFDAAPGIGRGENRERLHLGVEPDGRAFLRFLDNESGLAGRLHMSDKDALELQFARKRDDRHVSISAIDLTGFHRLPDYTVNPYP